LKILDLNVPKTFNPQDVNLYQPPVNSHKGQNGKLLVIGGSKLFHSSIFWSADVASRIVDLVHLTSPANENNQIFRKQLKQKFWNGIVTDWKDVEGYIEEDDCVLIGPGMIRESDTNDANRHANDTNNSLHSYEFVDSHRYQQLGSWAKSDKTGEIVNYFLKKYPTKKWVIDGGALQEVNLDLITESCILTPHRKEFQGLLSKTQSSKLKVQSHNSKLKAVQILSGQLRFATILLKGPVDIVCSGEKCTQISGGNAGMTKGGTGDVLAGLVAALYCKNDAWTTAAMASYINKKAGDNLYKRVGPYFNAEDLVKEVPLTIYGIID